MENLNKEDLGKMVNITLGRKAFKYEGRVIYEWEQSLDEVFVYIKTPECLLEKNLNEIKKNLQPGQKAPKLSVVFKTDHLSVGLEGTNPYINVK
jgi:hypothetical protein